MRTICASKLCSFVLIASLTALLATGCSSRPAAQAPRVVEVKAMQVIQRDTPITYVYVGQVQAKQEIKLQANVSGNIVAKMVKGGDIVQKGQPLFQIDRRQYEAAVLSAKAQLVQSEAVLSNSRLDTLRYKNLAASDAIAKQTLDTQLAVEKQNAALVDVNRAKLQQAEIDLADTLVVSPIDGRIDVNDLSVGSFVQAGATTLATISSVDPVFVQFSMSENEYLKLAQRENGALPNEWGNNLQLILSNGAKYPLTGQVEQVDRGLKQSTGTLTVKAVFKNPQKILVPGMFARVVAQGEVRKDALLIPQRAVQQMLDKTFVTVVGEGDKAETKEVKLGTKIDNLWLVESGLSPTDRVIAEGSVKVQAGMPLKVTMIGPEALNPAKQ